jgi:predicted nucleic acid-binding Zn ribbon protein
MAKKNQPMESLGAVLDPSLKRFDLSPRLDEYGVWPIWNDVVGKTIARNAQPEKIRNGTLFVKVTSPVWMQQLQFMKEMIVEKINLRLKSDTVKNLFFMVGHIDADEVDAPTESQQSHTAESAGIDVNEEFLESIGDPAIRAAFKKLLKSYSRRKIKP